MPIITISRGSHSLGQKVAELVAKNLGYNCVGRDVILEASDQFNIPEVKLIQAIEDPPSILERFTRGREKYIAYIRAALLKYFKEDNVVYHGLLGHHFVERIPHVIKVRVLADTELRTAVVMERDGLSEEKAQKMLADNDDARRRWSMHLYGVDPSDPNIYDLVVHVGKLDVNFAADTICRLAEAPSFQATKVSQGMVDDLALEAQLEVMLFDVFPENKVAAHSGSVTVYLKPPRTRGGASGEFDTHYLKNAELKITQLTEDLKEVLRVEVSPLRPDQTTQ